MMQDYKKSIKINCSATTCFEALTQQVNLWWSDLIEGETNTLNAIFCVHFDKTFKKMKVVEMIKNQMLVWECIDSYLDLDSLKNKSEWNDTKIVWIIRPSEDAIVLDVTHVGLNASVGCYDACEKGWDYFVANSLVPFLENGSGQPFKST
jgi:hypothetical protein